MTTVTIKNKTYPCEEIEVGPNMAAKTEVKRLFSVQGPRGAYYSLMQYKTGSWLMYSITSPHGKDQRFTESEVAA